MIVRSPENLSQLFEIDETAWLESMSALIREGNFDDCDHEHLAEYLDDMAKRDRRELESRLVVLLSHVLKWAGQPAKRSRSWLVTVDEQKYELGRLLTSGTLRRHAIAELNQVYEAARRRASVESGLDMSAFPAECPYSLDELLNIELQGDVAG